MRYGDIHTRIPASAEPPPAEGTITDVVINFGALGEDPYVSIAQIYYGTGAVDGYYSSKASFLSDNPGLTLQQLTGIAPAAGSLLVTNDTTTIYDFVDFTVMPTAVTLGDRVVYVSDFDFYLGTVGVASIYCAMDTHDHARTITLHFDPAVSAVGFNFAQNENTNNNGNGISFYAGVTLLHNQSTASIGTIHLVNVFDQFSGFVATA